MALKSIYKLFLFLFFCGLYTTNFAQQEAADLKELTNSADVIITGKVINQTSSWNEDQTRIYTRATIQVDEYIKGASTGNTVTIKYLGGEVGEVGELYSHMPRFEDNEEVMVFLKKDGNNNDYKVSNGENGKISLINDPSTQELMTNSNIRVSSLKRQIKNLMVE
jgi:hypothetical protein